MTYGDRKDPRVKFEAALDSVMIGVDGTWHRECAIADISQTGAKLILKTSMAGLNLREFFLVLTPNGKAYRRCELVRVEGDTIGVRFIAVHKGARRALGLRARV
ncbi:PilZ domain-containing protein [Rhodopseudomonas palustris]|uniref:PilZ domain-containing protein n=1 Tax=Rhodopseudomonas palustris TaxID=1076 RepID=UPI00115D3B62|nr:PilZ domain-containing protein [Rhodopseudomonas palustris]QDL98849.1 PilZ domain-containing protein [Rhodopseudomonas palustris]